MAEKGVSKGETFDTPSSLRELPDMMSALEGGSGNSGRSKGGCMNFRLQNRSKCRQG